jgi:superoxide dismutase, Cu-Zn family
MPAPPTFYLHIDDWKIADTTHRRMSSLGAHRMFAMHGGCARGMLGAVVMKMTTKRMALLTAGLLTLAATPAEAIPGAGVPRAHGGRHRVQVPVTLITAEGSGKPIGSLTFKDTSKGLQIAIDLSDLPPGEHGFHMHEQPSCAPGEKEGKKAAGLGAGGHFDPEGTKAHKGPGGGGHRGDLPKLTADGQGKVETKMVVTGMTVADIRGHAFVIHAGGDNYSDTPKPLGGGGDRIACAMVAAEGVK